MDSNLVITLWGFGLVIILAIPVIAISRARRRELADTDHRMVCIRDLKAGDLVDLEGDPFSDPLHDDPRFDTEYVMVEDVIAETAHCTLVHYDCHACGYPPDHVVRVAV